MALIAAENDLTLAQVGERLLGEHGVKADAGMLSRFFTRRGISLKNAFTQPSNCGLTSPCGARPGAPCSRC